MQQITNIVGDNHTINPSNEYVKYQHFKNNESYKKTNFWTNTINTNNKNSENRFDQICCELMFSFKDILAKSIQIVSCQEWISSVVKIDFIQENQLSLLIYQTLIFGFKIQWKSIWFL